MPLLKAQEPASLFYVPVTTSFRFSLQNVRFNHFHPPSGYHCAPVLASFHAYSSTVYKAARVRFLKKYLTSPHSPIHNSSVTSVKISYEVFKAIPNLEPTSSPITHFPTYYRAPTTWDYFSPSICQLGSCFLACARPSPTTSNVLPHSPDPPMDLCLISAPQTPALTTVPKAVTSHNSQSSFSFSSTAVVTI